MRVWFAHKRISDSRLLLIHVHMKTNNILKVAVNSRVYDVNYKRLLDATRRKLRLRSDSALASAIGVSPSYVSKVRHGKIPISSTTLLRIHEVTGWSIANLRAIMGDPKRRYWESPKITPSDTPTRPQDPSNGPSDLGER